MAAPAAAMIEELQVLLLAWEGELTQRKEAPAAQDEKVGISEKALAKVNADLDAEQNKVEATQKEYLGEIEAHTAAPNTPMA
jgi:hypothetical protein